MPEEKPAVIEGQQTNILTVDKKIHYFGMEDVSPIFAEIAAVRHSEQIFQILFFNTVVPIGESPEAIEALEAVPAKCVARIYVTPSLMRDLYNAMETNMRNWQKLIEYRRAEVAAESNKKTEEP